jgi:hypothetical protein
MTRRSTLAELVPAMNGLAPLPGLITGSDADAAGAGGRDRPYRRAPGRAAVDGDGHSPSARCSRAARTGRRPTSTPGVPPGSCAPIPTSIATTCALRGERARGRPALRSATERRLVRAAHRRLVGGRSRERGGDRLVARQALRQPSAGELAAQAGEIEPRALAADPAVGEVEDVQQAERGVTVPLIGERYRGVEGHSGYLLRQAWHTFRAAMDAALREHGLTSPQYAALTPRARPRLVGGRPRAGLQHHAAGDARRARDAAARRPRRPAPAPHPRTRRAAHAQRGGRAAPAGDDPRGARALDISPEDLAMVKTWLVLAAQRLERR